MPRATSLIVQKLLSLSAVAAAVGDRVYAHEAEQGKPLPYIVVFVDSWTPMGDRQTLQAQNDMYNYDIRVACHAKTFAEAEAIEEAVRTNGTDPGTGLQGFEGAVTGGTIEAAWYEGGSHEELRQEGTTHPIAVAVGNYTVQAEQSGHSYSTGG